MEPRRPTPGETPPAMPETIQGYYETARRFAETHYASVITYYRAMHTSEATPDLFWREYVWCVYAAGFNSKVLEAKWRALCEAYGSWRWLRLESQAQVMQVIRRDDKWRACLTVANLMQGAARAPGGCAVHRPEAEWWPAFWREWLATPGRMQGLPWIGPVNCYHLARNLGHDCVKPDLHLVRLAAHYGFASAYVMCSTLARLYNERVGVVDLVLFYAASTWGTLGIRKDGAR